MTFTIRIHEVRHAEPVEVHVVQTGDFATAALVHDLAFRALGKGGQIVAVEMENPGFGKITHRDEDVIRKPTLHRGEVPMKANPYDEALFRQKVKQLSHDGRVRIGDVEAAFWAVAWDLRVAIQQQSPEKIGLVEETFRKNLLPQFIILIKNELGLEVVD